MKRTTKRMKFATALALLAFAAGASACGDDEAATEEAAGLPQGSEPVTLDPTEFTTEIDNPYWPMTVGNRWIYEEEDEGGLLRVVVTVTPQTKEIANGVTARVVRDIVTEDGEAIEKTDDWYAQDAEGNIWYLGEATAEYENGKITTRSGSFEAGVDGAEAGIIMPADPQDGMTYRQEYYEGEAEDRAEVLSTEEQVQVPFGYFDEALLTRDLVPLEPRVSEYKLYAKGVGPVLTVKTSGGEGREALVRFKEG